MLRWLEPQRWCEAPRVTSSLPEACDARSACLIRQQVRQSTAWGHTTLRGAIKLAALLPPVQMIGIPSRHSSCVLGTAHLAFIVRMCAAGSASDLVEVDKEGAQGKVDDTPDDGEAKGEVLVGRDHRAHVQHLCGQARHPKERSM